MKRAVFNEISDIAYHFTDTTRLPWIIETGELQPDKNHIGGFPADLLWATTNDVGDLTSSAFAPLAMQAYRQHCIQLVRITLRASDFTPWREHIVIDPEWTYDHVRRLEQAAAKLGERSIEAWHCRSTALPLARAVAFHAKAYLAGGWVKIDATSKYCINTGVAGQRGFVIGEHAYFTTKSVNALGLTGYGNLQRQGVSRPAQRA